MEIPRQLSTNKKKIFESFMGTTDGSTLDEARDRQTGKALSRRTYEAHVPSLVREGFLIKTSPGNTKPYRYKPCTEFAPEASSDTIAVDNLTGLVRIAHERVRKVIGSIDTGESWVKPRRVKAICTQEIGPLLSSIAYLKRTGVEVTTPGGHSPFFDQNRRAYWNGIFGGNERKGTITVQNPRNETYHPDKAVFKGSRQPISWAISRDKEMTEDVNRLTWCPDGTCVSTPDNEDPWANPNLLEWKEYLSIVASELEKALGMKYGEGLPR